MISLPILIILSIIPVFITSGATQQDRLIDQIYCEIKNNPKIHLQPEEVVNAFFEVTLFIKQAQKYGCSHQQIMALLAREYGPCLLDSIKRINDLEKENAFSQQKISLKGVFAGLCIAGIGIALWYAVPLIFAMKMHPSGADWPDSGFSGGHFGHHSFNNADTVINIVNEEDPAPSVSIGHGAHLFSDTTPTHGPATRQEPS